MGKWAETAVLYADGNQTDTVGVNAEGNITASSAKRENIIPEKNRMSLVHALMILYKVQKAEKLMEQIGIEQCGEAFDVVFEWIDNVVLLLNRIGGNKHG
ncbi:MAG: hypothetical protein HDR04_06315 [Lachnospiraceae bacterium]|nr:hypothetical protein [Lachnospiraceae bacterium]